MPARPPALDRAHVVADLRAAGCVFAEDEARLLIAAAGSAAELAALTAQRIAGAPLEHVLGWAEFCGRRIAVGPGVFVPRRRTEFLVTHADARARRAAAAGAAPVVVVDLCCGSGAVAAALVAHGRELHAVDVDPAAVGFARGNLPGGRVHEGDLYAALPIPLRGRVDVLVANAPYVPTGQIGLLPPEARTHEPAAALDGGTDGMDVQRRVAAEAPQWLAPGGRLLIETSRGQARATAELVTAAGLVPRIARCDELDATVVIGRARR